LKVHTCGGKVLASKALQAVEIQGLPVFSLPNQKNELR
jgi:hypothetical protein